MFSLDLSSDSIKFRDLSSDIFIKKYMNIDVSDDLYYGTIVSKYKIKEEYLKDLVFNDKINFFIEDIDRHNLLKNVNMLVWFPYIFMPIGGYSYNRGFDFGFLYRMDNIDNSLVSFTAATTFGQNGRFYQHLNFENPNILKDKRLRMFTTLSFFTSAPQYQSKLNLFSKDNIFMNLFNTLWNKLKINFNGLDQTGLYFVGGFDYRIPKIEVNFTTFLQIDYRYDRSNLAKFEENCIEEKSILKHNLSLSLKEDIRWNKTKRTATIPVGNDLKASFSFYLPTSLGDFAKEFRFKSKIEEKYTKILFKDFAVKFRGTLFANYNLSEDFSGDPDLRGYFDGEITGFSGLFANVDFYIPVINVNINQAGGTPLLKDAKFLLYLNIFADGGFTIENYNFVLDKFPYSQRSGQPDTFQVNLGNGYALIPAFSVGAGLRVYPYFLNFILRLDFGVDLIKAIAYQKAPNLEFVFSFSDLY